MFRLDRKIVKSIYEIAGEKKMQVVAEYIESDEYQKRLQRQASAICGAILSASRSPSLPLSGGQTQRPGNVYRACRD
jgi:EAL domain-containing protein (putative c-di-GMP-specific phosphodiesterase class I)